VSYDVALSAGAERDLEELYDYIATSDSRENANYVLDRLWDMTERLSVAPERGSYPKELLALGIRDYRQAFFKPYRIIYRVFDSCVVVYLIIDGRRDLQSLLERRLLRS
jgi:toxin ParE1/3/4